MAVSTLPARLTSSNLDPTAMPVEVLEAELCRRAANMTSAEAEWLGLLAEFDRRQGWASWGCVSCASWLSWQLGLDLGAAREKVRVAKALEQLPRLAAAMATGRLSYSKVRALTRIANEYNEPDLVDLALSATSHQVERIVAAYRRCEPAAESADEQAHRDRGVWTRTSDAQCEIMVRLPAEAAKALLGAVDRFVVKDLAAGSVPARRADALVALAEHAVATEAEAGRPDTRYLATVVLTPDVLEADHESGGCCAVATGEGTAGDVEVSTPTSTAARMLCDAVLEGLVCDEDGDPLRLGRRRRIVSPRLRRALWFRDRGCRFPGCSNRGWLDAHHVRHWLDLGRTEKENLVLLCRTHHRFVHEEHWTIHGDPDGEVVFRSPTGRLVTSGPPVVIGDAGAIDARGRSPEDSRCGWAGDRLDLGDVVATLFLNESARRRRWAA